MRYLGTGQPHFLRMVGITQVPDWFLEIELCRHLGVDPEWFTRHHPIWRRWTLLHRNVTRRTEQGPRDLSHMALN